MKGAVKVLAGVTCTIMFIYSLVWVGTSLQSTNNHLASLIARDDDLSQQYKSLQKRYEVLAQNLTLIPEVVSELHTQGRIQQDIVNKLTLPSPLPCPTSSPCPSCPTPPPSPSLPPTCTSNEEPINFYALPKRPAGEKYVYFDVDKEAGINKQKKIMISGILIAHMTNRTFVFPTFSEAAGSKLNTIPFHEVLDENFLVENLRGFTNFAHREQIEGFDALRRYKVPKVCGPMENWPVQGARDEEIIDLWNHSDCAELYSNGTRAMYYGVLRAIRAAPKIRKGAEAIISKVKNARGDGVARPFVCLHARTEHDWQIFQGVAFAIENITSKMANYSFTFQGVPIDTLYIATGNYEPEKFNLFKAQFPYVFHKNDLLPPDNQIISSQYEVGTFKALLDYEVCIQAYYFVGNSHSVWSELVHEVMRLPIADFNWQKVLLTYTTYREELMPFCGKSAKWNWDDNCTRGPY